MIGWFLARAIGTFLSFVFRCTVPAAVRCQTVLLLLFFLIVDIHAPGIPNPISWISIPQSCWIYWFVWGKFPKLWKCSKVTALFKSGDWTNASNYRPISILPTPSKILEKSVHSQLYQYLVTNNPLTREQFGLRKGLSTSSALTSFADEVLLNME